MKRVILIGFLLLLSCRVLADIITVPHTGIGTAVSLEGTVGVEKPFTKHNSANFWTGIGLESMTGEWNHPGYKGEVAVEIKHYFSASAYRGLNLGLYSGFTYLNAPAVSRFSQVSSREELVGFVPGLKFSYLIRKGPLFQLEPYIGVSTPWYAYGFDELFDDISPGFILTLGFRASLNSMLNE